MNSTLPRISVVTPSFNQARVSARLYGRRDLHSARGMLDDLKPKENKAANRETMEKITRRELLAGSVAMAVSPTWAQAEPPSELVPSGSITVSTDDQVIEGKDITGNITINGRGRCKVRHCRTKVMPAAMTSM